MKLLKIHHRFPGVLPSIAVSVLLAALPGCAVPRNSSDAAPVGRLESMPETSPDVRLGDALLESLQKGDYETFITLWPEAELGEEQFRRSRENFSAEFGEWKSSRYLTKLQTPLVENHVWVVTFERPASDGSGMIEQQMLFRLVTGEVDGKQVILGMGFL